MLRNLSDVDDDHFATRTYYLPAARFDNRRDLTTFVRDPRVDWKPANLAAIHAELKAAFGRMGKG